MELTAIVQQQNAQNTVARQHIETKDTADAAIQTKVYTYKAVSKYFECFGKLHPMILEWDPYNRKIYSSASASPWKYYPWLFNICFLVGILTGGSCIFSLVSASKIGIDSVMLSTIWLLFTAFYIVFTKTVYASYDDICLAFSRIQHLATSLPGRTESTSGMFNKWKMITYAYIFMMYEMCLMIFPLPELAVYLNVDPYYNVLQRVVDKPGLGTTVTRLVLTTTYMYEAVRIFSGYLAFLFHWLELQFICLKKLESTLLTDMDFIMAYKRLQITNMTWQKAFGEWIWLAMCDLFWLITCSGIISIRYVGIIDPSVYWFAPLVATVDFASIYMLFPFITESYEMTTKLVRVRHQGKRKMSKHIRLQLKALRAMSVKFGGTFPVTKQTVMSCYASIIDTIVGGILL